MAVSPDTMIGFITPNARGAPTKLAKRAAEDVSNVITTFHDMSTQNYELRQENKTLRDRLRTAEDSLATSNGALMTTQEHLSSAEEDNIQFQTQITYYKDSIEAYEEEVAEYQTAMSSLNQQLANKTKAALDAAESNKDKLIATLMHTNKCLTDPRRVNKALLASQVTKSIMATMDFLGTNNLTIETGGATLSVSSSSSSNITSSSSSSSSSGGYQVGGTLGGGNNTFNISADGIRVSGTNPTGFVHDCVTVTGTSDGTVATFTGADNVTLHMNMLPTCFICADRPTDTIVTCCQKLMCEECCTKRKAQPKNSACPFCAGELTFFKLPDLITATANL